MRLPVLRTLLLPVALLFSLVRPGPTRAAVLQEAARPLEVDRRGEVAVTATPAGQARLTASAAWQGFVARQPGWRVRWNEATATPERLTGPGTRLAGHRVVTDASVEAAAREFITTAGGPWLAGLELEAVRTQATGAGWTGVGGTGGRGGSTGWWVHFTQSWRGLPVFGARLSLRVTPDGRVPVVTNHTFADIAAPTRPTIPAAQAVRAAAEGFERIPPAEGEPTLVILPLTKGPRTEYRLAWRVETRTGLAAPDEPVGDWISLVDATSGALLYRMNNARDAVVRGPVTGAIEMVSPNFNFTTQGMSAVGATVNGPAGSFNTLTSYGGELYFNYGATTGRTLTVALSGPFGRIENQAQGGATPSFTLPLADGDSVGVSVLFDDVNSTPSERDAWYHAMVAHDFIKTIEPGYSFCDYVMPIRVELNQTCNAYWDGYGVNFFHEGGGCANTGRMATVIMHEYGHAITDYMYRPFFPSGAMHECFSDYYACTITNQPIVGPGFQGPGTFIRRIDNDRIYPDDVTGEIHTDGLILASALWDAREALGAAHADSLWHFARYGYADNFDDYFFDYLLEDDNDGDVYNGTPHLPAIAAIFKAHGIGDFGVDVVFTPYADSEDTTRTFPLTARFYSIYPLEAGSTQAHVVIAGPGGESTADITLLPTGGTREFSTTLPAQPAGTVVTYHFVAQDSTGTMARLPDSGEFAFRVGTDTTPPVIVHEPLRDQPVDQGAVTVVAHVTDNLDKGEGFIDLVARKSGVGPVMDPAPFTPRSTPHDYGATISLAFAALSDTVSYQIRATDQATLPNSANDPPSGYHTFRIVRGLGRDFEENDGGFTATGDFTWGTPTGPTTPGAWSGTKTWGTKLSGGYSDDLTSTLTLPPVDLTGWTRASLVFRHWYQTEPDFDGGRVEISLDGGATWNPLTPDGGYPNPRVVTFGAPAYSGESGGWQAAEFDLYRYAGQADVRLRFRFISDQALHATGWFLDDVQVVERQTLSRPIGLATTSGLRARVPLRWEVPAGQEGAGASPVLGYRVERAAPGEEYVPLVAEPLGALEYVDTTALNGVPYRYRVIAVYAEGQSAPAGPVVGFPYTPRLAVTGDTYIATLPRVATLDTLLGVANTGTGFLQVNGYVGSLAQEIDDVRYAIVTGDTASAGRPPVGPAIASVAGGTTVAAPAPGADDVDEAALARLARGLHAASEGAAARRVRGLVTAAGVAPPVHPLGVPAPWDTLGDDPDDFSNLIPDLKTFAYRLDGGLIDFQVSAWEPWGAFNEFNMVVAINTDGNSTNGFAGGEYLVIGGAIIQASFNQPALLINSDFVPVAILPYYRLTNGDSLAEFSVRLSDIENPTRITVNALSLDSSGAQLLDRMPDRTAAFYQMANRYLVVSADQPGNYRLLFNSANLTPGFYEALLFLDTNDPAARSASVPVRMVVTNATPVELAEFGALATETGVHLTWRTTGETDHAGFHVYRRAEDDAAGAAPGDDPEHGARLTDALLAPARDGRYDYLDGTAEPGRRYAYYLADVSRGGEIHFHGPVHALAGPGLPAALALAPVTPNPARGQALLRFGLPRAAHATLRLYRVDGRLVRTLLDQAELAGGWHESRWDGRDDTGAVAPAGLYFARVETPFGSRARKLIWAR